MTDLEIGWVAGLLEGEGYFQVRPRDGVDFHDVRIQCNMTDLDVLERLQAITGLGSIRGPFNAKPAVHKDHYRWTMHRRSEIEPLVRELRPHMGRRRGERLDEMIAYFDSHPPRRYLASRKELQNATA